MAYTYNNAGETLEASNTVGSSLYSTPVADYTYSYDSVGNVSDVTAKFAGVTDEYDNPVAIQLASAYDYNGDRTTLAANIGGATATLDENGDFSDFTTGTDDFVNNYSYDPLGEMTKIVQTARQRRRLLADDQRRRAEDRDDGLQRRRHGGGRQPLRHGRPRRAQFLYARCRRVLRVRR